MPYAICNETFQNWPLARACDFAAECGYEGLEIAPFTLGRLATDVSPAQREEIGRTIARAGLECVGLHWLLANTESFHVTHPDADVRKRTVAYPGSARVAGASPRGRAPTASSNSHRLSSSTGSRRCHRRLLRLVRPTAISRHLPTLKAKLMARVGEEFPLECPGCGGDIRLIALHPSRGQ
jgi:hypothetical protein